jgi:hypothetical protein
MFPDWAQRTIPVIPTLFLFGTRKPFLFHDTNWAAALSERRDGSGQYSFDGDHYFFLERQHEVELEVDRFLDH